MLLGLGLGGFFDGTVLHQILQWHHLVSQVYPPDTLTNLRLNTWADGLFDAASWVMTALGSFLLWSGTREWPGPRQTSPRQTSAFAGTLLFGFGLFNVVEGTLDHFLLRLHHVRPGPDQLAYDVGFLLWGLAMLLLGRWLIWRGQAPSSGEPRRPYS